MINIIRFFQDFVLIIALLINRVFKSFPKYDNEVAGRDVVLIGNGPSLNKDRARILDCARHNHVVVAMNFFLLSDFSKEIKVDRYFIVDHLFWRSDLNESLASRVNLLFAALQSVDYPMQVYVPRDGVERVRNQLSCNQNILVLAIDTNGLLPFSNSLAVCLFRLGILSVPSINVAVTAVWVLLRNKVQSITIFGCDFSNFKDFVVDQNTNDLSLQVEHFYSNSKGEEESCQKLETRTSKRLHDRLGQAALAFRSMVLLAEYATITGVKIKNKSSFSYIDAFER